MEHFPDELNHRAPVDPKCRLNPHAIHATRRALVRVGFPQDTGWGCLSSCWKHKQVGPMKQRSDIRRPGPASKKERAIGNVKEKGELNRSNVSMGRAESAQKMNQRQEHRLRVGKQQNQCRHSEIHRRVVEILAPGGPHTVGIQEEALQADKLQRLCRLLQTRNKRVPLQEPKRPHVAVCSAQQAVMLMSQRQQEVGETDKALLLAIAVQ